MDGNESKVKEYHSLWNGKICSLPHIRQWSLSNFTVSARKLPAHLSGVFLLGTAFLKLELINPSSLLALSHSDLG